ncbi:MAG: cytochrome c peroxidase [Flavobacteriales bacterium]
MMRKTTSVFLGFAFLLLLTAGSIDLGNLFNYYGLAVPAYITKDNAPAPNAADNMRATLGRVLFYDARLSVNNAISCASCHKQEFAFGDTAVRSVGHTGGLTGRHSMRLINARFGTETRFFWNERASSLDDQTSQPIQDAVEMGFSGQGGQPGIDSLIRKLESIPEYPALFQLAFGSPDISEMYIQRALSTFLRSIASFDSKFDVGMAQAPNLGAPFPNFSAQENNGKTLFLTPPPAGAGCQGCHRGPEFDIDPNSRNNNIVAVAGGQPGQLDLGNTRSPSLRDLVNPAGQLNGPLMHDGSKTSLMQVIDHYNLIVPVPGNTNLDPRLAGPQNQGQNLNLSNADKTALVAFLRTLSGTAVYTAEQWSNPFDANGNIDFIGLPLSTQASASFSWKVYPNPSSDWLKVELPQGLTAELTVTNAQGQVIRKVGSSAGFVLNVQELPAGIYQVRIQDAQGKTWVKKWMKQ